MKKNFKWYVVIAISILSIIFLTTYYFNNENIGNRDNNGGNDFSLNENNQAVGGKLAIPPLLEDKNPEDGKSEFDLIAQTGQTEFIKGHKTETLGYNGSYLGPIIKINKGDEIKINVENTLEETTTVHWHGLEVVGEMDGGPHQVIKSGTTWSPYFTVDQPAATLWYHPHLLGKTGEQVYKGLAGLIYIEDEESEKLDIPRDHGVNDIPLIVQDKRFASNGDIPYDLSMEDIMNGFHGDTVLVNGSINPELDVKNEIVRLRLLNGSNARTYDFRFDNNESFFQIASDGGFLKESVELESIKLSPGERAEILIDLSKYKKGDQLVLKDFDHELLSININDEINEVSNIPKNLIAFNNYNENEVVKTREFVMSGMGHMVAINGKQMDMDRIDEEVKLGELEEWVISNDSSGMGMMNSSSPHPFHVHGAQFQIIERNGEAPALNERGWKDTVMVEDKEEVRILIKFSKEGLFMYHCHILEHEDSGMIGQFSVE